MVLCPQEDVEELVSGARARCLRARVGVAKELVLVGDVAGALRIDREVLLEDMQLAVELFLEIYPAW